MGRDSLSENELERYARQIFLPQVGEKGQLKLKESSVLIVGLGGLGSSIALLMAGTGIGTLGLLDDDIVKLGNLPRQVLYTTADIGEFKAAAAKKRLTQRNPEVSFRVHQQKLTLKMLRKSSGITTLSWMGPITFSPAESSIKPVLRLESPMFTALPTILMG